MLTVVTLLRGDRAYTARWADAWRHMPKPEGTQLFIGSNNDFDTQIGVELNARVFPTSKPTADGELARIGHVAKLYEMILPQVTTAKVLIWEDDILPPPDSLQKMMDTEHNGAGLISITPFHDDVEPRHAILFWDDSETPMILQGLPESGMDEVFGGGTAYSLWNTADLQATLPWPIKTEAHGTIPGWDIVLARKLKAAGKKTMVDFSIRCYHG